MKTWNDHKEYVRTVDPKTAKDIKETEDGCNCHCHG